MRAPEVGDRAVAVDRIRNLHAGHQRLGGCLAVGAGNVAIRQDHRQDAVL